MGHTTLGHSLNIWGDTNFVQLFLGGIFSSRYYIITTADNTVAGMYCFVINKSYFTCCF